MVNEHIARPKPNWSPRAGVPHSDPSGGSVTVGHSATANYPFAEITSFRFAGMATNWRSSFPTLRKVRNHAAIARALGRPYI